MNNRIAIAILGILMLFAFVPIRAQKGESDKLTVSLTDPSRPARLKVEILNGSIDVRGYSGKEVIVEARIRSEEEDDEEDASDEKENAKHKGLRRIANTSTGLSVEEDDNEVTVGTSMMGGGRTVDVVVQVPSSTSMKLNTVNDGDIHVSDVRGDIEASDINGSITLTNISGSAVVDALNGEITVTFAAVDPKKTMSFSSMNGDMDVTLPADTKALLKMKTEQGEIYSDFDVRMENSPAKVEDNQSRKRGKYRVTLEKMMTGSINGGGPEIIFKNYNGSIYIRKAR